MSVRTIQDSVKYHADNKSAIETGQIRLIREYGTEGQAHRFISMKYDDFRKFLMIRRNKMLGLKMPKDIPTGLKFAIKSEFSYEEVIFMNAPHTFTADIDMENVDKEINAKYWKYIHRGLPALLKIVGVNNPQDYLRASLTHNPEMDCMPTDVHVNVMKSLWVATHAAMTIARLTRYNGAFESNYDTIYTIGVTIEASIVDKKTLDISDKIKKYSYHIRTSNEYVYNNQAAKMVGQYLNACMLMAAMNGMVVDKPEAKNVDSACRTLVTRLIDHGYYTPVKHHIAAMVSFLPEKYHARATIISNICPIDWQFFSSRHNLRLAYEVKPGGDRYLFPYTFACAEIEARRTIPMGMSVKAEYTSTSAPSITAILPDNEYLESHGSSSKTFITAAIKRFEAEKNAKVHATAKDGLYSIEYKKGGYACEVCNVTHEKSTHNILRFSGPFCTLTCHRREVHNGRSVLFARDDEYDADLTSEEKMGRIIRKEMSRQRLNTHDDDDEDDDDETESRSDNAVKTILEGDDSMNISHDVTIFSAPTLIADDNVRDDGDDYHRPKITVPKNGMMYIRSALGTGKTKWLLRHITKTLSGDKHHGFIVLSTRLVQTQAFIEKYNAFICEFIDEEYTSRKEREALKADWMFVAYNKTNDVTAHRNIIVQVDSLGKLSVEYLQKKKFTLILDEAVSILEQTQSSNIRDYMLVTDIFRLTMGYAHNAILMDGHVIAEHIECFDKIRGLMTSARSKAGRQIDCRPKVYVNTYQPQNDRTYYMTTNRDNWLTQLAYKAGSAQRCRIVVATNSLDCCRTVADMIKNSDDDFLKSRDIRVYTSETGEIEKKTAFDNVHESWAEADILIYSPTVGAGISFELKRFDILFGYCSVGSTTAETFVQLLNRVRDIRHNDAYVFVDPMMTYGLYTTIPALRRAIVDDEYNADGINRTVDNDGNHVIADEQRVNGILRMYATTHENRSKACMVRRVTKLLLHLSQHVDVFEIDEDAEKVFYKDHKESAKMAAYDRFDAADVLDDDEYEELKELKKMGCTTASQGLSVDKTAIMKKYKMSRDFTRDGWASDYMPFIDEHAEKLRYVAENETPDIIEKIKEQSKKVAGTVVSEYVDKAIVSHAILTLADHLGTPTIIHNDDAGTKVTFSDGKVTSWQVCSGEADLKMASEKHSNKSWVKFMKTAANFGKKSNVIKVATATKLLSGKASKWAKSYMSMYNEILGYLTDGAEGCKKSAKSLDTLHRRLAKAIFTFYGNDSTGKDVLTFKRAVTIRFGQSGEADDWKTHTPRIIPIINEDGHKYLKREDKFEFVGEWEDDVPKNKTSIMDKIKKVAKGAMKMINQ